MTKKFINVLLVLTILFGFNLFKIDNFGVETAKADETNLLLTNGDFDNPAISSTNLGGWQVEDSWGVRTSDSNFEYSVVAGANPANSADKALKLTTVDNNDKSRAPIAVSPAIVVNNGDSFMVSFDYKATYIPAANATLPATLTAMINLGWTEYINSWTHVPGAMQNFKVQFVKGETGWQKLQYGIYNINNADIKNIKLLLGGPQLMSGAAITYDNVVVTKLDTALASTYGCKNESGTSCLDFGTALPAGTITPLISVSDPISPLSGDPTNQVLLQKTIVTLKIPSDEFSLIGDFLNVSKNKSVPNTQLLNKDLMLEIRYRDDFSSDPNSGVKQRVATVSARSDFGRKDSSVDPEYDVYYDVYSDTLLTLGDIGDKNWKIAQVLIEKTNWQQIKSFGGNFYLRITMPAQAVTLPIDYVSLTQVEPAVAIAYKEKQRNEKMFTQVNNPDKPSSAKPGLHGDYAWFTSPSTEQIFPNYYPTQAQIDQPGKLVALQATQGETESGNFSIITNVDLNNVSLVSPILINAANGQTIPVANIKMYKTVYDYKFWSNTSGLGSTYGLQPDRYEQFTTTDIPSNTTQQFYFTVSIPDKLPKGTYTGDITVKIGNQSDVHIPVSLDSLGMKLDPPTYDAILYQNPIRSKLETFYGADKLGADISGHDLSAISNSGIVTPLNYRYGDATMNFDYSQFTTDLSAYKKNGYAGDHIYYWSIIDVAKKIINTIRSAQSASGVVAVPPPPARTIYNDYTDTTFQAAFIKWTQETIAEAKKQGLDISFSINDEPEANLVKRAESYFLYPLLKEAGATTWASYNAKCEVPLPCTADICPTNITIPSLGEPSGTAPIYVDYKLYTMSNLNQTNISKYPDKFGYYTTFFAQARNPVYTRFLQGLYAVKTGAKVVATYHYNDYYGDPYNDFDSRPTFRYPATWPDYLMNYPSWDGQLIPTTAWEATREGIKDSKYIATLRRLIDANPNSTVAAAAKTYLYDLIDKVKSDYVNDYQSQANDFGFSDAIIKTVSNTNSASDAVAFDTMRAKIFDYIKQLSKQLSKPAFSISADKTSVATGGIIKFTVQVTNQNTSLFTNIDVTSRIPAGTEFVSAENGGVVVDGEVKWPQLPQLLPNGTFSATYQVRVN